MGPVSTSYTKLDSVYQNYAFETCAARFYRSNALHVTNQQDNIAANIVITNLPLYKYSTSHIKNNGYQETDNYGKHVVEYSTVNTLYIN